MIPGFQSLMLPLLEAVQDGEEHRVGEVVKRYVERIEKRIVLVDGDMLTELLLDNKVGVTVARTYEVPRVDLDYFELA